MIEASSIAKAEVAPSETAAHRAADHVPTTAPTLPTDRPFGWREIAVALLLPIVLFGLLRPETYGLVPNALDPVFYTGYAINFDDAIEALGDTHYFVSRWSSYYPSYLFTRLLGPHFGRLGLRLVLAAMVLVAIWNAGREQNWRWSQRLLIGSIVLSMPMFLRAFLTDYVEFMVVALGLCVVAMSIRAEQSLASAALAGTLSGLAIVANPYAVTVVGLPLLVAAFAGQTTAYRRLIAAGLIGLAGTSVLAGGLIFFRWRYGIDNIYQPTIDFIRSSPPSDPRRSPRNDWLWHYAWLWITPSLLLFAVGSAKATGERIERPERIALLLAAIQYAYQWFDQFGRGGNGLEVSYYWSFSYPSLALAAALVIGRLSRGRRPLHLAGIAVAWFGLLLLGVTDSLRLPSGGAFFVLAIIVTLGSAFLARSAPVLALGSLITFAAWTQVGAPIFDPSSYHEYDVSPLYDRIVGERGNRSDAFYDETIWFADVADTIGDDTLASFVPITAEASYMSAIYGPHVKNRLLGYDLDTFEFDSMVVNELRSGVRNVVIVLGPAESVARMMSVNAAEFDLGQVVVDEHSDTALDYRIVAIRMPNTLAAPVVWEADLLASQTGDLVGSDRIAEPGDGAGFLTFGPYRPLPAGRYRATLYYRSAAARTAVDGAFDVFAGERGALETVDVPGTSGESGTVAIRFEVDAGTPPLEFRTSWAGASELTVDRVVIEQD